jgi:uncharacterized protein YdiU (UPF0061 family)
MEAYYVPEQLTNENRARIGNWIRRYRIRVIKDGTPSNTRRSLMNATNPKFVLRNYLVRPEINLSSL